MTTTAVGGREPVTLVLGRRASSGGALALCATPHTVASGVIDGIDAPSFGLLRTSGYMRRIR